MSIGAGYENPDDELEPKPEHTGKHLLQVVEDFSWHIHSAPNGHENLFCKGSREFKRAEILEATHFDVNKERQTIDIELDWETHLINVPKQYILLSEEFL